MRILIVTQFYPPESLITLEPELAETLQALGHEVTVLTGFPNYPSGNLYPGYRIKHWRRETINGVRVIRVPLFPDHGRGALKRSLNYLSFAASAAVLGPWLSGRVDLVHAIQPVTAGWAAWAISRVLRVPYTTDVFDMWPETLAATGMVSSSRVLAAVGWLAKFVYSRAAAVRVVSNGFKQNLIEKGIPAKRIHVVSNWIDPDEQRPVEYNGDLAKRLGLDGQFNIMYAGSIGLPQRLDVVLDAAEKLADLPRVQFVFVGGGPDTERLKSLATDRGLANVKFLGMWPTEDMPRLYALADVLMLHLARAPLFSITIPSKVFGYMSASRPVLAAVDGEASEMVESRGVGLACPPEDPAALAVAVRRFYGMSPEELAVMGRRSRAAVVQAFGRDRLVGQIVEIFNQVVSRNERIPKKWP